MRFRFLHRSSTKVISYKAISILVLKFVFLCQNIFFSVQTILTVFCCHQSWTKTVFFYRKNLFCFKFKTCVLFQKKFETPKKLILNVFLFIQEKLCPFPSFKFSNNFLFETCIFLVEITAFKLTETPGSYKKKDMFKIVKQACFYVVFHVL